MAAVLIGAAAAAIYGPTVGYDFVWDDRALLQEDVRIRSLAGVLESFGSDFFRSSDHTLRYGYYRPVVTVTYALDFLVWRDWPGGYHLTNIFLHVLCTLGTLLLGRHLGLGLWVSAGMALLFAAHPMHTESVSWISGRTDVIATLFAIGYLLGFDHRQKHLRWAAHVSFALAALSKEVSLAAPAVAFFICAVRTQAPFRARVKQILPSVPILIGYLLIRAAVVPLKPSSGAPHGWSQHLFAPMSGLSRYLKMLVWPGEQSSYLQTPSPSNLADPWVALGLAIILLGVHLWLTHRRVGQMMFAVLLSFIPMANIVRVAGPRDMGFPMSERFLYLPSLVLALTLGLAWVHLRQRLKPAMALRGSRIATGAVCIAAVGLAMRTVERSKVWANDEALFTDAKTKVEDAPLIDWQLASVRRRAGDLKEAYALALGAVQRSRERGIRIPVAMIVTLATTTALQGDQQGAIRVLNRYRRETGAENAMIAYNLGVLYEEIGEPAAALAAFEKACELRPKYLPAFLARAVTLLRLNRPEEAIPLLEHVTRVDPRHASAWHALGLAFRIGDQPDRSLEAFLESVRLKPEVVSPRIDAAAALLDTDPQRALDLLTAVAADNPDHPKLQRAIHIVGEAVAE